MATTADGWPYVLPSDKPVEFPAHSQALANLLESRWDTYETSGVVTLTSPWAVGSGGQAIVTRSGGVVTLELLLTVTSNVTLSASWNAVGTVPSGFRPLTSRWIPAQINTGSAYTSAPGFVELTTAGALGARHIAGATLTANTAILNCAITYRGA